MNLSSGTGSDAYAFIERGCFAGFWGAQQKADRVERFEASGVFRLRRSIMGTDNAIAPLVLICASLAVAIAFSGSFFY